jgi:hypothetical protein
VAVAAVLFRGVASVRVPPSRSRVLGAKPCSSAEDPALTIESLFYYFGA